MLCLRVWVEDAGRRLQDFYCTEEVHPVVQTNVGFKGDPKDKATLRCKMNFKRVRRGRLRAGLLQGGSALVCGVGFRLSGQSFVCKVSGLRSWDVRV